MKPKSEAPFYIGYLATPPGLKLFLIGVASLLLGAFAALGLAMGTAQDDPGTGEFHWGWGAQTVAGHLEIKPYPVLHVTQGTDRIPAGRSLLLAGGGKTGIQDRVRDLDGRFVQLRGIALKRGDIHALQVGGAADAIEPVDGGRPELTVEPLGRWRLQGEICDGKCVAGAMRPGQGLSHRACANLCLIGGAPPVFVSTAPVGGNDFFLMGDSDGNPLPERYLQHVAKLVAVDGTVERRGGILLFKIALESLKVL